MKEIFEILFLIPLSNIFHVILSFTSLLTKNEVINIILFSIVLNMIFYQLFFRLEKQQKLLRKKSDNLKKNTLWLKKNYNGVELHSYVVYLRKVLNISHFDLLKFNQVLVVQIIFFSSSYYFLINLASTSTMEFLQNPDQLLFGISILPIVMTLINFINLYFYTDKSSNRALGFFVALLFLILLYNSPSLLVIFWISNNIISLIRTLQIQGRFLRT